MGSSRGMPGNYENNYYPRGTAANARATHTRARALDRWAGGEERERERGGRRLQILTERGIIIPVPRPGVACCDPARGSLNLVAVC